MTTYEEWRVTGKRRDLGPAVDQIIRGEDAARAWVTKVPAKLWTDGPHFQRRTVTLGKWRDAGPPCINVTGTDQTPGSAWVCGPECPKEA